MCFDAYSGIVCCPREFQPPISSIKINPMPSVLDVALGKSMQLILLAGGPFYTYPWKPLCNSLYGDTYEVALKHFKEGHYGAVNLGLHGACLLIQVFGNMALLCRLDALIPQPVEGVRLVALSSLLTWAAHLLLSPAPKVVSLASTVVLTAGYLAGPHITVDLYEKGSIAALLVAFVLSNTAAPRRQKLSIVKSASFVFGFVAWYAAWASFRTAFWESQSQHRDIMSVVLGTFVVLTSLTSNPIKKVVVGATLLSKVLGILSGNETMLFHGYAFFASLCQGISHLITKEEATLLALERKGGDAKVRFEFAHVGYFPNIFLQTALDYIQG